LDAGAVVGAATPEEPVVAGALELPRVELDEPVVDRVVVLTPMRARTPLSRLITRLRLTPSSTATPRRRRSMMVVLRDGALA
jgi:hypothetical protein